MKLALVSFLTWAASNQLTNVGSIRNWTYETCAGVNPSGFPLPLPRCNLIEFRQIAWYRYSSKDAHCITVQVCQNDITTVLGQKDHQSQQIRENSTHECSHANLERFPVLWQKCLTHHEDHQAQNEPKLWYHELARNHTIPQSVGHHVNYRMWNDLGITQAHQGCESSRKMSMRIKDEVFDIKVHSSQTIFGQTWAPYQTLQKSFQDRCSFCANDLYNIRVPHKQIIHAIVVSW